MNEIRGMFSFVFKLTVLVLGVLVAAQEPDENGIVDCTDFCSIPVYTEVTKGRQIAKVRLPESFRLYFEYNIQYWFDEESNLIEIQCEPSRKVFRMNLQFPNIVKPYLGGKLIYDERPKAQPVELTVQPESRNPNKIERFFNPFTLSFLETNLHFEGFEFHQDKWLGIGGLHEWGVCTVYASTDRNKLEPVPGAMIRNLQIVGLSFQPTLTPSELPTPSPNVQITPKPSPEPSTAMPTNDPLCCSDVSYVTEWKSCLNAADPATPDVTLDGEKAPCDYCLSYMCVDWTIGSKAMQERAYSYSEATGDKVNFAVGSYGNDPAKAGLCYRLDVEGVDNDIIMQVTSDGPSIQENHIRIQMANGGLGFDDNACSRLAAEQPQFPVSDESWGDLTMGWPTKDECSNLPKYPMCGKLKEDDLQELCEWTFDIGLKQAHPGGQKRKGPSANTVCQVTCPYQLWQATGFHRSDEPKINDFQCNAENIQYTIPREEDVEDGIVPESAVMQLKGLMDCAKPSYAIFDNVQRAYNSGAQFYHGHDVVVPCKRDGYARINQAPTAQPTSLPTEVPTSRPSAIPTSYPTSHPSLSYRPTIEPTLKGFVPFNDTTGEGGTVINPDQPVNKKVFRRTNKAADSASGPLGGISRLGYVILAGIVLLATGVFIRYERARLARLAEELEERKQLRRERKRLVRVVMRSAV